MCLGKDELVSARIQMLCNGRTYAGEIQRHVEGMMHTCDCDSSNNNHIHHSKYVNMLWLIGNKYHIVFDGCKADADFDLALPPGEKCSAWTLENHTEWARSAVGNDAECGESAAMNVEVA